MFPAKIHDYIIQEESNFESNEVQVGDNWWWNFRKHVQLIFHMVNDVFFTGNNNWLRAFKQIMEPIINLSAWTEDIEVKDIEFFIKGKKGRELSFILKKYHDEVYTKKHDLDKFFDDITETDLTYGGLLVQKAKNCPEVLFLQSIAFCDQTDMLGSPIGLKYNFAPEKLKSMSKNHGWGKEENDANIDIDTLITLATYEKDADGTLDENSNRTPGKQIEVYIVKGALPEHYLKDNNNMEDYVEQIQVVAFYTNPEKVKESAILYRKKGKSNLKAFTSKPVHNRALGRSEGEKMLHPQIWTNFLTIHKMNALEAASKVPLYTDDPTYKNKNRIQDMETLEITSIEDGKDIKQVPTAAPVNIQLMQQSVDEFLNHAQFLGSAFDPLLGEQQTSGTTFRGLERTVQQGRGMHDRRRGKRAKFIEELYRDWIIPDMVSEITSGTEFLSSFSTDELSWVADRTVNRKVNTKAREAFLKLKPMTQEDKENLRQFERDKFIQGGGKKMIKVLEDEFKGIEIEMGISIGNKQKNLADLSDKVLSIFQFIFKNPQFFQQAMQVPVLSKAFSDILEFSGLSIGDFNSVLQKTQESQVPATGETVQKQLQLTNQNEGNQT